MYQMTEFFHIFGCFTSIRIWSPKSGPNPAAAYHHHLLGLTGLTNLSSASSLRSVFRQSLRNITKEKYPYCAK